MLHLRTRLTIWFAASLLLILAPCFAGVLYLEWRAMREALDHHLQEDLEVAAEMLLPVDGAIRWRTDAERDLGYDGARQRWVEVYGPAGEPLYFRGLPAWYPAIRETMPPPGAGSSGLRSMQTPAGATVRVLSVAKDLGARRVWLRMARTEDPMRADFRHLLLIFAGGVPLAVLTAAGAGYVVAGRALAPLARMAERARLISADRLSERLPVEAPGDELGQLSIVFNETFARLEESFEHLKRFTADASHELRTPLTALRSVGEVGLREPMSVDGYREVIGSMLEESDRLARLVDTLLTLSRWESGRVLPVFAPIDFRDVAREVVERIGILADERGITLRLDLPHPLPVSADRTMIRQAVLNVVDNAIKFTPAGGSVRIASHAASAVFQLIVDDDGPGIPETDRTRVLERFYRVNADDAERPAGTGLGLSIAHRALTANLGRIELTTHAGGGTRVILELPA
ncbi:MAG: sensor histidine kinase [Luteitalea sp.]